jgi:uncharacterized protein (TIGR02246 family)
MSQKEISQREQDWLAAFNGGDASGVAQLYAEKGRLLPPDVDILEGRGAIEEYINGFLQTGAKLAFDLLTVHESPDLCAAVGRYDLKFPAEAGIPNDNGKYIEVWARQSDGTWLMVDDIFNSSVPAPTP